MLLLDLKSFYACISICTMATALLQPYPSLGQHPAVSGGYLGRYLVAGDLNLCVRQLPDIFALRKPCPSVGDMARYLVRTRAVVPDITTLFFLICRLKAYAVADDEAQHLAKTSVIL